MSRHARTGRCAAAPARVLAGLGTIGMLAPLGATAYLPLDGSTPTVPALPVYLAGMCLGQWLHAAVARAHGLRAVVVLGTWMFAVASLVLALGVTGPAFVLARLGQGVGAAAGVFGAWAVMPMLWRLGRPPQAPVLLGMIQAAGVLLAPCLAALLPADLRGPGCSLGLAALGVLGLVLAINLPRLTVRSPRLLPSPRLRAATRRGVWRATAAGALARACLFGVVALVPASVSGPPGSQGLAMPAALAVAGVLAGALAGRGTALALRAGRTTPAATAALLGRLQFAAASVASACMPAVPGPWAWLVTGLLLAAVLLLVEAGLARGQPQWWSRPSSS